MSARTYQLWVVLKPSAELPGGWVSHCLELDLVSQGTSYKNALETIREGIFMVILEDLALKRNPLSRRAPEKFFAELKKIVNEGDRVTSDQLKDVDKADATKPEAVALLLFAVVSEPPRKPGPKLPKAPAKSAQTEVPQAWVRGGELTTA